MRPPLNRLSATQLVRLVASREVNCEAITHSFLDAVEQRERDVHAFTWIDPGRALSIARVTTTAQASRRAGRVTDCRQRRDRHCVATEYGSPIYAGRVPRADAASVAAVRAAGGYVFGKTVTAELANFTPGATRNPHGLEHTPGGSSSGSAAAVAAHMTPFALGTQTAGR